MHPHCSTCSTSTSVQKQKIIRRRAIGAREKQQKVCHCSASFSVHFWARFGDLHNAKNLMIRMLALLKGFSRFLFSFASFTTRANDERLEICSPLINLNFHFDTKVFNFLADRKGENFLDTFSLKQKRKSRHVFGSFISRRHDFMFGTSERFAVSVARWRLTWLAMSALVLVHTRCRNAFCENQ